MSVVRQIMIVLLLLAGAAGGWWVYQSAGTGAPLPGAGGEAVGILVEVEEVRLGTIADDIEAIGTLLASQSVEITAKSAGQVEQILFHAGQRVERGDVLVRLDSNIETADLDEAKALMEDARQQLQRARQLLATRAVAQARVDELETAFAAARARVAAAEQRLADRVVTAPFAGIVGIREVDPGARVTDDTVLTTLDDVAEMALEVRIPEVFFGAVRRGQEVRAATAAFPNEEFAGAIAVIDSRIDPVARSFRARATLPNSDGRLVPGLFMVARITLAERPDAILIPEQAVVAEGGATYVYRVRDDRAQRVPVTLGLRRIGEVEVISGLAPGDIVVTAGLQRLRDGQPVRVRSAGTGPVTVSADDKERMPG